MCCSENVKWSFCGKNHFLFSDQVQKMHLGQIAKNGPKMGQKWAKNWLSGKNNILSFWLENQKWFFFTKKKAIFDLLVKWRKCILYLIVSFWPIFGDLTQMHLLDLVRKQKVIFSTKRSLFIFLATHFSEQKKVL